MSEPKESDENQEITDPIEHTRIMLNALQSHDLFVRAMGVNQLGELGQEHPNIVVPKLIEALSLHADFWTVRFGSAEALGLIGNPKVVKPLIPFLKDEDPDFRTKIAETMFVLADPSSERRLSKEEMSLTVDPLIAALKDENPDTRANAARTLGYVGDQKATEPLINLTQDSDANVRKETADALGMLKNDKAVDTLVTLLEDDFMKVRLATAHALREIASQKAVISLIKIGLKDEDRKPRDEVAKALVAIGNQAVLKEIRKSSEDEKSIAQLLYETIVFVSDPELKEEYGKLRDKHLPPYSSSLGSIAASVDAVLSFVDDSFRNLGQTKDLDELNRMRQSSRERNILLNDIDWGQFYDFDWIKGELYEKLGQTRRKFRIARQSIVELDNALADRQVQIDAEELVAPLEELEEKEEEAES